MDTVRRLLAYHEIGDVIGRYCMLFDDQDWDGLADLWTADASFEVEDKCLRAPRRAARLLAHLFASWLSEQAHDRSSGHRPWRRTARRSARTDVVWISGNFENTIVARYHDDLVNQDGAGASAVDSRFRCTTRRDHPDVGDRNERERGNDARRRSRRAEPLRTNEGTVPEWPQMTTRS